MEIFDKLFKKKAIESQQSIPVKQDKQEKTTVNMVTQKAEPTVKEQLIRGYVGTYKKQVDYATVKELKKRYIAFDVETTCKLRSNGMFVPPKRNGHSILIGTKYRCS